MSEQATQVDQNPTGVPGGAATATPVASSSGHVPSQLQQQQQQQQQNQQFMQQFWNQQLMLAEQFNSDFKNHPLPLARIKKVMKSDQDVKMISAEAPILFSKACEIFISEITMRAWIHAEENKRRTLQRSDVASAVTRSDQFDFLIDIVPREEIPKVARRPKDEVVGQTPDSMYDPNMLAYYQQAPGIQYSADASSYYPIQHEHFSSIHFPQIQQQPPQQGQQQQGHAAYAQPQQDGHRPGPQPPGAPQAHVPHDQQQQGQQGQQQPPAPSTSHQSHPGEQATSRQTSSPAIKSDTSLSHEGIPQTAGMVTAVQHEQSSGTGKRVAKRKK